MNDKPAMAKKRLLSPDILRGADMFLLTVIGPFVWALDKAFGLPKGMLASAALLFAVLKTRSDAKQKGICP